MLSKRLKEFRMTLNYSQENMADKLDCPYQTISKYERGLVKPSSDILTKLGLELNANINWLLTGQGPMFLPTKNEKLEKYEQAFKERITFGKRLNYYQAEENLMDDEIAKIIDSTESRVEKLGLDKNEPTLAELKALKSYSGIPLDLWIDGELMGDSACAEQTLSPEERKMLEFLKKAKENKLI